MNRSSETVLLHNPQCSKSRAALAMLIEHGVEFSVREYLSEPLDREELDSLHALLGAHPREWVRTGEAQWGQSGLDLGSEAGLILDAIADSPVLLQRPILIRGEQAVIGRPPTLLLGLLED